MARESEGSDSKQEIRRPIPVRFGRRCQASTALREVVSSQRLISLAPRPADKPGSVVGGHLSGTAVTRCLKQPTRRSKETGSLLSRRSESPSCSALLPVGVAWPPVSPQAPVVSYTTFSPSPGRLCRPGCLLFCGPFPSGFPAWVLPSTTPYGARTFLTQNLDRWPRIGRNRLAGLSADSS